MSVEEWHRAVQVKTTGSMNLWEVLTSNTTSTLDFFTMLSSIVSLIGNNGQTNYGAGNAYQDAMARYLSSQGHNVVALNAPVLSDAGLVAVRPALLEYMLSIGFACMSLGELINALDYYCRPSSQEEAQIIPRLWLPKYSANEGAEQASWQHEPIYRNLVLRGAQGGSGLFGKGSSGKHSTPELIAATESLEAAQQLVLDALMKYLAKMLSYELTDLDSAQSMNEYGVDSLVAVELRVWMTKEIGADVSVFELTSGQSIEKLAAKAAASSRFLPHWSAGP